MRVLLVKEEKELRHTLAFLLESDLSYMVVEAGTPEEALRALADPDQIDYVICDDKPANLPLLSHLATIKFGIGVILIKPEGKEPGLHYPDMVAGYVRPASIVPDIRTLSSQGKLPTREITGPDAEEMNYIRIGAELITQVMPLRADTYLKLSANKYIKVFRKGDTIKGKDVADFLAAKKIEYLYVRREDAVFLMGKMQEMLEALVNDPNQTPAQATQAATGIQAAVSQLSSRMGFTPEVQALAKQGIKMTLKTIGQNPSLARMVRNLIASKDGYLSSHSVLTTQVACGIAHAMGWPSGTTFQKLAYAGFFHDMMFTNPKIAQVKTLEELEKRKMEFSEKDVAEYKAHPIATAEAIAKFNEIPADVDVILLQHHEMPDGSGFPRKLPAMQIAPLACVFIVAHDLVDHLLEHGSAGIDTFVPTYRKTHAVGHFRKVIDALEKHLAEDPSVKPPT